MEKKCIICSKNVTSKRKTAKFCSLKCSSISQKGRKLPHTKEWEEKRLNSVRKWAKEKVWDRGYKRPLEHTQSMRDVLKIDRINRKQFYYETAIRNLSKNKSLSLSKENSPQWLGGLTKISTMWRNENRLKLENWRKVVIERDSYTCRDCGSKEKLEAHHIVPIAETKAYAFLPMNGIILCKRCHHKTDSYGGKIRRTREEKIGKTTFKILTIPHKYQEYSTTGNYGIGEDGSVLVFISDMNNENYEFLVAIHEMIELMLCIDRNISFESINKWDIENPDLEEPGDHEDAPYRKEHMFASMVERLLADEMGVDWEEYNLAMNNLYK